MAGRKSIRIAAWGALLAMALHALSPLAAPAPRDRAPSLHDICTTAPAAPQPAGDPSTSHCALCVQPASMAASHVAVFQDSGFSFFVPECFAAAPVLRPTATHSARAPPAGA